jgi:predicted transcriptional regulator
METLNALSARSLQYYVMAEHWASDLEFFKIESVFFDKLINEYFIAIGEASGTEALRNLLNKISRLKEDEQATAKMLTEQLQQLELMAEDFIPENIDSIQGEQVKLEYIITNLTREFREVKKELFLTIERVVKQSK